jgi:hypothetical protein
VIWCDGELRATTGIELDLFGDFKLAAEFRVDWENEPAQDTKKTDTRYMLKIGYDYLIATAMQVYTFQILADLYDQILSPRW